MRAGADVQAEAQRRWDVRRAIRAITLPRHRRQDVFRTSTPASPDPFPRTGFPSRVVFYGPSAW
eukprot:9497505-Pyramimonas_sp.AAC.1